MTRNGSVPNAAAGGSASLHDADELRCKTSGRQNQFTETQKLSRKTMWSLIWCSKPCTGSVLSMARRRRALGNHLTIRYFHQKRSSPDTYFRGVNYNGEVCFPVCFFLYHTPA
ncbi:hypothetical protein SCLCIDRAFT_567387 [Scleroderma citrinum Foug A]|uniref:Uncharacterized protein n=1 Tax=Scleroderma citrinum Foug A TaxID=1036808 RepID=A0A0C2YRL9_9AGAM|nr:hypothetical protein SCLCIDRAFT_567387 [Scleroderma citrinum Foug A]